MRVLKGMIHFLNETIEMEVGALLREFIGCEEYQLKCDVRLLREKWTPSSRKVLVPTQLEARGNVVLNPSFHLEESFVIIVLF
jgi:hypothetical protein